MSSEVYISVDVETDGPVPGMYSMLSLGMALAGHRDEAGFTRASQPRASSFYAELRPVGDDCDPDALAASGLDREWLERHGHDPAEVMNSAATWVKQVSADRTPIFLGYPASFDWMFTRYYFERYAEGGSPFRHNAVLDMKTMLAMKTGLPISEAVWEAIPPEYRTDLVDRHHALDDAVDQAVVFGRLWGWSGQTIGEGR